jgi:Alginate lyase
MRIRPSAAVVLLAAAATSVATASRDTVVVLLLDGTHLAGVRDRLRQGDPTLTRALSAVEADAKTALGLAPLSVMDKAVTPPSGDKHDYMSQAPYWWPDPSRPDGKPYIRRDGERNPEISRITDHDNLGRLTSAVATLGLAFHLTGREEYATQAARLVRAWFLDPATRMNPHLRYGQGIPGTNDGRGIGIIETRGLPELVDGVGLLGGSPAWTGADRIGLQAWMRDYLTWLVESPHGNEEATNGNNHETWYDVQVTALALYTGQPDLARRTVDGARQRIARQIEPDGRMPRELERTRAWDYSEFNLRAFFNLATLGDRVGIDLWRYRTEDGRSLRQALDFLVPYASGDRPWPYRQITTFRPGALHWLLRRAAMVWNEPRYRRLANNIGGGSDRLALTVP